MEIRKKVWYNIIGIVIIEYYNLYARFVFHFYLKENAVHRCDGKGTQSAFQKQAIKNKI